LDGVVTQEAVTGWRRIGTVVGNAGTAEFTFILQQFQARVGDIVALGMDVPDPSYSGKSRIYVWARITGIQRFNPFFPFEAAQEIAGQGISLEDTVLSNTRDQLEASALILGATSSENLRALFPLTYPVKPAATVYHPPADAVRELLIGGRSDDADTSLSVGTLIARGDVEVTLDAPKLVARHMAILAMTGGGKTVAARRILRELSAKGYPLVILDPHGDYIGLVKAQDVLRQDNPDCTVRLFYPELLVQKDGEELVGRLIAQMTSGLTDPQAEYLRALYERVPAKGGEQALKYISRLISQQTGDLGNGAPPPGTPNNWRPTVYVVGRNLRIVQERLARMEKTSDSMRARLKGFAWEPLPSPFTEPEQIVRPNQVSVVYLGGYDHVTQCSIAAITLETLFEARANLSGRIPPFFAAIEEAHTFIPSAREGTEDAVSLPIIRRIITEGRKFGTGLLLISQRPSRLDETIVSQCNSFLILRLVNPRDQAFVRSIMENLSDADARMLPGFGPGQGIVSGQVVRFPLPVSVRMDPELLATEIGDEDFFDQVSRWKPDKKEAVRRNVAAAMRKVNQNRRKKKA
jgi:DNA helicase HerA-like ATPase